MYLSLVSSYSFFRHKDSAYEQPEAGEGRGRFFINYLPAIVRAHHSVFPEWDMVIHHDERVMEYNYFVVLEEMHRQGLLRLEYMGEAETLCGSMLWRMKPVWDEEVDATICRDIDSLPTPRERKAVDRWLDSGKGFHAMQDSISHRGTLLLGGMVGFLHSFGPLYSYSDFRREILLLNIDYNRHGADQVALAGIFKGWLNHLQLDDKKTLGKKVEERDKLASHIGGAYHTLPVIKWYDEHEPNWKILQIEQDLGVKF